MSPEIQLGLQNIIGNYGWMFITALVIFLFKTTIESMISGFMVFAGKDLDTDDVIRFDGRPARVIRVGIWKTIFFMYDVEKLNGDFKVTSGTKVAIQNDQIKFHLIEKPLPKLDIEYLNGKNK